MPTAPSQNEQDYLTGENMKQNDKEINNFFRDFIGMNFRDKKRKIVKVAFFRHFLMKSLLFYHDFPPKKRWIFSPRFSLNIRESFFLTIQDAFSSLFFEAKLEEKGRGVLHLFR